MSRRRTGMHCTPRTRCPRRDTPPAGGRCACMSRPVSVEDQDSRCVEHQSSVCNSRRSVSNNVRVCVEILPQKGADTRARPALCRLRMASASVSSTNPVCATRRDTPPAGGRYACMSRPVPVEDHVSRCVQHQSSVSAVCPTLFECASRYLPREGEDARARRAMQEGSSVEDIG